MYQWCAESAAVSGAAAGDVRSDAAIAEQGRQRRSVRRLQTLLAAALAALALAVAGGLVAVNQQGRAGAASRVADAKRLGNQAWRGSCAGCRPLRREFATWDQVTGELTLSSRRSRPYCLP
jgi:hypothetical protein